MYKAVQPRLVTEFTYRHAPNKKALVFMSLERADDGLTPDEEVQGVLDSLAPLGVHAVDVTDDELAKSHARYLLGNRGAHITGERLVRFEFPEQPGSLDSFLSALRDEWFVTMLHYRNHGGQVGKVLAGVQVPPDQELAFNNVLDTLGYTFHDETHNPIFENFMR